MSVDVYLLASYRGWIMEAIPRESALAISQKVNLRFLATSKREIFNLSNFFSLIKPTGSKMNVYMNHSSFFNHKGTQKSEIRVFITHFDSDFFLSGDQLEKLKKVDVFLVQNSFIRNSLVSIGLDAERMRVVCGAISYNEFFPLDSSEWIKNQVLIVGDCKPRKNPKLIEETIRLNPSTNFVIHGKNWGQFTNLLKSPPKNLRVIPFEMANQAKLMRESSVLLSLASNEGGPFPILESLASGTPVVATATGFAPDLINGGNGVLLPINPTLNEISEAIDLCLNLKLESWSKDMTFGNFSWESLGNLIFK